MMFCMNHASDMNMVVTLCPAARGHNEDIALLLLVGLANTRSNDLLFVGHRISCCPEQTSLTGKRSHKHVASKLD